MPYHEKIPYVRCGCGFRKDNGKYTELTIAAGAYCPQCGTRLTEYNELTRQSMYFAGDAVRFDDTVTDWRSVAFQAGGVGLGLAIAYGVMRLIASSSPNTITINGETVPFYDMTMVNGVFAALGFVAMVLLAIQYGPGYVKHRRLA